MYDPKKMMHFGAGRSACRVYESFEAAASSLAEEMPAVSTAVIIRGEADAENSAQAAGELSELLAGSCRSRDSFIAVPNREMARRLHFPVFYSETGWDELYFRIQDGDLIDFQIPAGRFGVDLIGEADQMPSFARGYVCEQVTALPDDIRVIADRYTRIYLIRGSERNLMIDFGFGNGDLKKLQKDFADGPWIQAMTHGHKDHCGGIGQFEECYGSRRDLEDAGLQYLGELRELADGTVIDLGDRHVQVLALGGHSCMDYVYYLMEDEILICGDLVATGPNYTMTKGGDLDAWIRSIERLMDFPYPIRRIFCSHRQGEVSPEILPELHKYLKQLRDGELFTYQASVYGFENVYWAGDEKISFFS